MLNQIVADRRILSVITELEELENIDPAIREGAILILKNELGPPPDDDKTQTIVFNQRFALPLGIGQRFTKRVSEAGALIAARKLFGDLWFWIRGRDQERFRDLCDRCFWRIMVPSISESYGSFADRVLNTINEAIINYAEYSFKPWSMRRRIHVHLFKTDRNFAYVIIRPAGTRLKSFDPLALKTRTADPNHAKKRGWGHTLLMKRALFLSFDLEPKRRGMLVIIGSEDPDPA